VQRDPLKPVDHLMGGIVGTIVVLVVIAGILPVIFGYVIALGVMAIVIRLVWFYTSGRW
jgi:hypothetical protein